MSGTAFCDFNPSDPACQDPLDDLDASNATEGENSDYYNEVLQEEQEFLEEYGGMPAIAKLGFLVLASRGMVYTGLQAFRYVDFEYFDDDDLEYVDIKVNWDKWAKYLMYYGGFGLFSLGWLFQLLDLLGIAGPLNFMVWGFGLGMLGPLVYAVAVFMEYFMYERAYNCSENYENDNSVTQAASRAICEGYMSYPKLIMNEWILYSSEAWAMIMMFTKPWIATQWEQLPEEKKEKYRNRSAGWKEKKDAFALFGF